MHAHIFSIEKNKLKVLTGSNFPQNSAGDATLIFQRIEGFAQLPTYQVHQETLNRMATYPAEENKAYPGWFSTGTESPLAL